MNNKTDKPKNWQPYWLDFRNGDMDAFRSIYVAFFDRLYDYGSKLTSDKAILEDSIQELFLQLYTQREKLSDPERLEFYLLKSLKLIIYQRFRKRNKLVFTGTNEKDDDSQFVFLQELQDEENTDEDDKRLDKILSTLDANKRELLYLKFYQDLSYKEIGSLLGIQPDSAKKQVYRIIARLKDNLKNISLELLLIFSKR